MNKQVPPIDTDKLEPRVTSLHLRGFSQTTNHAHTDSRSRLEEFTTLPQTASASSRRQGGQMRFFQNPKKIESESSDRNKNSFYTSLLDAGANIMVKQADKLGLMNQDQVTKVTPLDRPIGGGFYKRELAKFMDGVITAEELIQSLNYPRLALKQEDSQLKTLKNVSLMNNAYRMRTMIAQNNISKHRRVGFFVNAEAENMAKELLQKQKQKEQQDEEEKLERERKRQMMRRKLNKLRNLINNRIEQRRMLNYKGKDSELQAVSFLRQCFNLDEDYSENIKNKQEKAKSVQYFEKCLPASKKLHTCRLNYEDLGTLTKQIPYGAVTMREDNQQSLAALKSSLEKNADIYLEEIAHKKAAHKEKLDRLVRLNIETANQTARREYVIKNKVMPKETEETAFKIFHKAPKVDRFNRNGQGVLTYQDIQLYDYIYNTPDHDVLKLEQNPHYVQNLMQSEFDIENDHVKETFIAQRKTNKNKMSSLKFKPIKKNKTSYVQETKKHFDVDHDHRFSDESNDSSLRSIYEVNLDSIYSKTLELKEKIGEPSVGFVKRIKQRLKLEDLSKKAVVLNLQKLNVAPKH